MRSISVINWATLIWRSSAMMSNCSQNSGSRLTAVRSPLIVTLRLQRGLQSLGWPEHIRRRLFERFLRDVNMLQAKQLARREKEREGNGNGT
jgi:hypothetical protein